MSYDSKLRFQCWFVPFTVILVCFAINENIADASQFQIKVNKLWISINCNRTNRRCHEKMWFENVRLEPYCLLYLTRCLSAFLSFASYISIFLLHKSFPSILQQLCNARSFSQAFVTLFLLYRSSNNQKLPETNKKFSSSFSSWIEKVVHSRKFIYFCCFAMKIKQHSIEWKEKLNKRIFSSFLRRSKRFLFRN